MYAKQYVVELNTSLFYIKKYEKDWSRVYLKSLSPVTVIMFSEVVIRNNLF